MIFSGLHDFIKIKVLAPCGRYS